MGNSELTKLKEELIAKDLLLSFGTEGIVITSEGKVLFANEQIAKILGYNSSDELIGQPVSKFVAHRSQKLVMENIKKDFSKPYESFSLRKDGSEFPTITFASQAEFMGKTVRITTIKDFTEFYNSRIQLEASERRYKSLFNQIPLTIWVEDASDMLKYAKTIGLDKIEDLQDYLDSNPDVVFQGLAKLKIYDVNNAALELIEVSDKNILLNSIGEFFTDKSLKRFSKPMTAIIKKQKSFEMESEFITATGKVVDIHIYWRVLPGYEEDYSRIITVITDISERIKVEAEKRKIDSKFERVQKLESLENFASGISNDFSNLLVGILGNVNLALKQIDPTSPIIDLLKEIDESGKKASNLTKQLQVYSGRGKITKKLFNLNELIEEMQDFMKLTVSDKVGISNYLSTTDPWIEADRVQVSRLIINLLTNASESMRDGGIITLKTFHITKQRLENYSGIIVIQPADSPFYTCLEINDYGIGIEENIVHKIFDPFYSNKIKRSGLGLSVVRGIVKQHEGGLIVETQLKEGTSFKILFPLSLDYKSVKKYQLFANKDFDYVPEGKILIVDDEPAVLSVVCKFLKSIGYDAISASDGYKAIKVYQENSDIKLVVLDLIMEKISGQQTFVELRKINPHLPIVISSGYSKDDRYSNFNDEESIGFLQKPYSIDELKHVISSLI